MPKKNKKFRPFEQDGTGKNQDSSDSEDYSDPLSKMNELKNFVINACNLKDDKSIKLYSKMEDKKKASSNS
jgi:hypothetical protein